MIPSRAADTAVVGLALHLAIILVTREPDLEDCGQIRVLVHDDVVAALRARNYMREENNVPERQRAVSRFGRHTAVFGYHKTVLAGKAITQGRTVIRQNPDLLARVHFG